MKPKHKTNNVSQLLALISTIAAIISNLGKDVGPVIRWITALAAILSISWAIKNYPPHNYPLAWRNFYRKHSVVLQRVLSILVLAVGVSLLGFLSCSVRSQDWGVSLLPTNTPTVEPSPSPVPTVTLTTVPTIAATPMLFPTSSPTPTPSPTLIFHVVEKHHNLWCIAEKYYGKANGLLYAYICRANQESGQIGDDCNELQVGEKLLIPTKQDFPWAPIPDPLPTPGTEGVNYFCEDSPY